MISQVFASTVFESKKHFFKSNKFIFVLNVFLLWIEEIKLNNYFLNLNITFFWV